MNFPEHKCGLYLTHNEHRDCYQTVGEFVADLEYIDISDEDLATCLATDELWSLQWYPDTPIGSCRVLGPTLERVLELAKP